MADTQSLFGLPPELVQQAQQAALSQSATNFAQLDPYQRASYGAFMGGAQAGNAVGGMLGGQDPQIQLARMRQSVLSELDPADPTTYQKAAAKLLQAKDYQGAQALVSQAQTIAKNSADVRYKDAETAAKLSEKLTPEQKNAAGFADSQGLARGTPEWAKAYATKLESLISGANQDKGEIKEVGVATGTQEPVYTWKKDGKVQQVVMRTGPDGTQTMVPYQGGVDRTTAKTNVNVKTPGTVQETEFAKRRGMKQADALTAAEEEAKNSGRALGTLAEMERRDLKGIYSGPQADLVKDSANFLESVGLLSKEQTTKLTDATVYDKQAKDLVMQDLNGKLGAQVSDADRKYVEARIPQLTTNPQARKELIAKLREIHLKKINDYQRMSTHANKYGQLNDFDFSGVSTLYDKSGKPVDAAPAEGTAANPIKLTPRK